ncbi:hypothetical protein TRFO_38258 [Tritrichomonas foetus]|uniref:Uncharacterized protein n=1 Tax=Tritrichomonas foetus TaxID=1144522 RepID=A0A1J4JBL4_9EUKA|nr:hypothetical protein TRFO_38258 [Tritrichomonas foetus]|eukprot:OHS95631.1 hypothetical protein TRFO_38258 [Tritrichomonas foetus]
MAKPGRPTKHVKARYISFTCNNEQSFYLLDDHGVIMKKNGNFVLHSLEKIDDQISSQIIITSYNSAINTEPSTPIAQSPQSPNHSNDQLSTFEIDVMPNQYQLISDFTNVSDVKDDDFFCTDENYLSENSEDFRLCSDNVYNLYFQESVSFVDSEKLDLGLDFLDF